MKKNILLALISLFVVSIGVSAADYHIEWFDIPDATMVEYSAERFVMDSDSEMRQFVIDVDGNVIASEFLWIMPLYDDGTMIADKSSFWDDDVDYYIIKSDGTAEQTKKVSISEYDPVFGFQSTDFLAPEFDIFQEKAEEIWHFGKYVILQNNDVKNGKTVFEYAVADETGEMLTDFIYDKHIYIRNHPEILFLFNDETHDAAIINRRSGKIVLEKYFDFYKGADAEDIPLYIMEDGSGKFRLYNGSLDMVADGFDKPVANIDYNISFDKDGDRYVFDDKGNLTYKGKENVVVSLFSRYVISDDGKTMMLTDSEFNELLPAEYEFIKPIAENVWIVGQNDKRFVINNGRTVTGEYYEVKNRYNYIVAYDMEKAFPYNIFKNHTIYDFEGNIIYNDYNDVIKGVINNRIIVKDGERIGKLISNNSNPHIKINGEYLYTDTLPRIRNNITLVPIRAIAEKLGFEAAFKDGEIKITKDEKEIIFNIGSRKAIINGEEKELSAPPEIINDRTLVPIRAVAEAFGMEIKCNEDLRVVELMHNQSEV